MAKTAAEATALQRKIFSRWVAQKVAAKGKKVGDCVTDFKDGTMLIYLLETLSEKNFPNWKGIKTGSKMNNVDACNQALKFVKECGVEGKMFPSAENLVDGEERSVMGLIWAIMLKFMKLDDDEGDEKSSAGTFADALKMWVANQVGSYGLDVPNMTKAFHDGKIFCALINKFRPKLLDYNQTTGDANANLNLAFNAANKYFGLERYLETTDIPKLDDKSMVVYVSEYYYGIARQRKVDLAAQRIEKLIRFTKENDALKADYSDRSVKLRSRLDKVHGVLADNTIENTMAGAVRRLGLFNDYRQQDKAYVFGETGALDSMYQKLARRLASRKRPVFQTPAKCSVVDLQGTLDQVASMEAKQNVALHEELNRQIRLSKTYAMYTGKHAELSAWTTDKRNYLDAPEEVLSVGAANFALNKLDSFFTAFRAQKEGLPAMRAWAQELISNHFEHSDKVKHAEGEVSSSIAELEQKANAKKTKLDADLKREIRKEELRVEWAKLADEFLGISKATCAAAPNTMFGFNLEEVEAFAAKLKDMDSTVSGQASALKHRYDPVWAEMQQLGVKENVYSHLVPHDLETAQTALAEALASRQHRFATELEKQRGDDKACRDLKAAVDPFVEVIKQNTQQVTNYDQHDLPGLLTLVKKLQPAPDASALGGIQAAQATMEKRGVIYNRHTLNNGKDAEVQFRQYQEYMSTKKAMIEAEIEYRELRGLTKQDYEDMKKQFDQFDKDKSGFLDKREFRSCLYSMGEERGKKEIEAILTKLGNGDPNNIKISYDGYKNFMIEQLGDTDTQEEIIKGFKLMNRQEETCQWPIMGDVMEEVSLEYIKSTHGTNYKDWTTSVFAR